MASILQHKTILLIEDDPSLLNKLQGYFIDYQVHIQTAQNLQQAYACLKKCIPHLVILDRNLEQNNDGLEILEYIRNTSQLEKIATVMLTGDKSEEAKQLAHQLHADAYITKPFNLPDFNRQIEALLRRTLVLHDETINLADGVSFNLSSKSLLINNADIKLTNTDYKVLHTLCKKRGRTISRYYMINNIWDDSADIHPHNVDVAVSRLRSTLKDFNYLIKTMPNAGYKLISLTEAQESSDKT